MEIWNSISVRYLVKVRQMIWHSLTCRTLSSKSNIPTNIHIFRTEDQSGCTGVQEIVSFIRIGVRFQSFQTHCAPRYRIVNYTADMLLICCTIVWVLYILRWARNKCSEKSFTFIYCLLRSGNREQRSLPAEHRYQDDTCTYTSTKIITTITL